MGTLLNDIQYGFVAGELSKTLLGRTDLEKYDLGLELAKNWFVDYRGGLSTRPGQEFIDFVQHDDKDTKFFAFRFAPDVSTTYVILFGQDYVRFIQNGSYVLEAGKAVTGVTQASPGVVTSAAHGFSAGDWVKAFDIVGMTELNQRTFQVGTVTTNTFQLLDPFGNAVDTTGYTAYSSGGSFFRIYTISSPYATTDLALLRGHQSRSQITLTHPSYKKRSLVRVSDTNWTLSEVTIGPAIAPPSSVTLTPSAAGTAGVAVAVTAVDADGNESIASAYSYNTLSVDYTSTEGQLKITWPHVAGAVNYRVYRSLVIPVGADISRAQELGYIGTAFGTQLIDRNIIPDFTQTPPTYNNPFADASVQFIEVTAGGTGYTRASTVTVTGSGSGFVGYPVVDDAGTIQGIVVVNGGKGYVSPTVAVSGGTGATFVVTLSPTSGNDPSVSSVFQQREVSAGSLNKPLTVWGSKPGAFNDYDVSAVVRDSDSYEFDIDAEEVAPIRHLVASRSGLVIINQSGIWQLTGGQGVAVTPTNALADPQSYTGCSNVPPIPIDTDILYNEGKGTTVRLLSYSDYTKVYSGQDMSILSNHLFSKDKQIVSWSYASDPYKLVYAVRSDGALLTFTLDKEQNVFAWTPGWTKGLYLDVITLQESNTDTTYLMVKRRINGRWTKFIEKIASRQFSSVEDAWCVDAGLTRESNYPAASLTPGAATGLGVTFSASAAVFTIDHVGAVLRVGGGKAKIKTFVDSTHVTADILRDITNVLPEDPDNTPLDAASGEWSLDIPVTVISNLWHLEGQTVVILADGNVVPQKTVTNGKITLDAAATRITIGLPYTCIAKSLSPTIANHVIEHKLKRVIGVNLRVSDTRGLKVGDDLDHLTTFLERTDEIPGEPTKLQNGVKFHTIDANFGVEGTVYYVQDNPLPATILGFVRETEIGDDAKGA